MRINPRALGLFVVLTSAASAVAAQMQSAWALPNFSHRLDVSVTNPGSQPMNTLAALDIATARRVAPAFPGMLAIAVEEKNGVHFLPSQIDPGAGDAGQGAFIFAVQLSPHEREQVSIYYSQTIQEDLPWPKRVHAAHSYGHNHATAALESELIGYRSYGGFFFDVQAHRKGELGLFNSLIGFSLISRPPVVGQDVIHLGDTLGLGGLFLRANGKVFRPPFNTPDYMHQPAKSDEPQYRVLAAGPLRALIEAQLPHWKIGNDEVALRAVYELREGDEVVHCRFWIIPLRLSQSYDVGAGILDLPQMRLAEQNGRLALEGIQEAAVGRIALGLAYSPADAHPGGAVATSDGDNQVIVFNRRFEQGHAFSGEYSFVAAWQGSGWSDPLGHALNALKNASADPTVKLLDDQETPEPGRLLSEPE